MAQVSLTTICDAIENGTFDKGLGRLAESVQVRRLALKTAKENILWDKLDIGSHVRLTARRPSYAYGLTGKVVEFGRTRVTVELDSGPTGRFKSGRVICPLSILELIEPVKPILPAEDLEIVEIRQMPTGNVIWKKGMSEASRVLAMNGNMVQAQFGPKKPGLQAHLEKILNEDYEENA